MSSVIHPRLAEDEYICLQYNAGWILPLELIDGEAVVTPPLGGHASSVQGALYGALLSWQEKTGDQGLLLQDVFVRLAPDHYPAPDIAWWSGERRPPVVQGAEEAVPDLVVEVLSPSTRANDLGPKRERYLSAGVRELWLVDPASATVTRVRPGADDELIAGDELRSALLPGFSVPLARIFAV